MSRHAGHRDDPTLGLVLSPGGPGTTDWTDVDSSWVHSYRRVPSALVVRYKDKKTGAVTATCQYDDPDGSLADGMDQAPSKGKYVHAALYHLPYDEL